ncbi:MAG: efflux RND transporter periplasmic adaptor subunit [Candidatus Sumerlaeota bacterium]|nr:efflux RND transporter periplasmic adaptor subunit [Candidatus Sumerlaeota bacterium]
MPVPVLAATATREDLPVQLSAVGRVDPYSTVTVKALVGGQLTGVHFQEGQDVKKGDLLFTIDPRPYEALLHQNQANLAKDTVAAQHAEMEMKRFSNLQAGGAAAKEEYDTARADYDAKQAQLLADTSAVEYAALQVEYCTISSPLDGRVGEKLVDVGNLVKVNDSSLVIINQISPVFVSFSIPERYLAVVQRYVAGGEGLIVKAVVPGQEDRPATGTLTFINNQVDVATGSIQLKGTFANEDGRLWPGHFVDVTLNLTVRPNALVVPSQAIQTGQDGQYVYVIRPDMTVENRTVDTGLAVAGVTEVTTGVKDGDRVVTDGQMRLIPGAKVEIKSGLLPSPKAAESAGAPGSRATSKPPAKNP